MIPQNGDLHRWSVQQTVPLAQGGGSPIMSMVFQMATAADTITPWGSSPHIRDVQLREFWRTEPWLASSIGMIAARNAAYSYTLTGPPLTVKRVNQILATAGLNHEGWAAFIGRFTLDRMTQDNGAYIELLRMGPNATDPVVGLANLDPARCFPTADPDYPVIYQDIKGAYHNLRPWQVVRSQELPSTDERLNGLGTCAVSRVLRAAQMIRDFEIYKSEKAAGRDPGAINFVAGVSQQAMDDALKGFQERGDNAGLMRYIGPMIMAIVDPNATVSTATIQLKALPDGYDEDISTKWYTVILALALGTDPQDIAPLSGASLGTGAQSQVLAQKSRGKGPAAFQKEVSYIMNWCGVLPKNVEFAFDEDDLEAEHAEAENAKLRAEGRKVRLDSGEITPEVAQQLALEAGDLTQEQYDLLRAAADQTDEEVSGMAEPEPGENMPMDMVSNGDTQESNQDSPGVNGAEMMTEGEKAISPTVTPADERRARSFWRRIMPEYADLLDAKTADA